MNMNNTLYIAVGLPGSGKSTYAKNFIKGKDIEYLSSDELRAVFGKGEDDQTWAHLFLVTSKERLTNF